MEILKTVKPLLKQQASSKNPSKIPALVVMANLYESYSMSLDNQNVFVCKKCMDSFKQELESNKVKVFELLKKAQLNLKEAIKYIPKDNQISDNIKTINQSLKGMDYKPTAEKGTLSTVFISTFRSISQILTRLASFFS